MPVVRFFSSPHTKNKIFIWQGLLCCLISLANTRVSELDWKHVFSSVTINLMGLILVGFCFLVAFFFEFLTHFFVRRPILVLKLLSFSDFVRLFPLQIFCIEFPQQQQRESHTAMKSESTWICFFFFVRSISFMEMVQNRNWFVQIDGFLAFFLFPSSSVVSFMKRMSQTTNSLLRPGCFPAFRKKKGKLD
jgi:hypothetical protein